MKGATAAYIAKEEASKRKPVELYKIWWGLTYKYYNSGDNTVNFDDGDGTGAHDYLPATIQRNEAEYNSELEANVMKIQFAAVTDPTVQYIAQNPVAIVWIEISKLFRDQSPMEKLVVFIGQIKGATVKGTALEAECVSFEHFLSMPVPTLRYQVTCNHEVFDEGCTLDRDDSPYAVDASVTLDSSKTILTSAAFAGFDTNYFVGGLVVFGEESRTIVAYTGSTITMQYKMIELEDGDTVTAYPGCDGDIETCRDKFNNLLNFMGFPFIPEENPASRIPS